MESPNESRAQLRRLYGLAAAREFVIGRDELYKAGFGRSRIDNWCRTGRLINLFFAVYGYGRDIDTRSAALQAALIAAGDGSFLFGRTACEEWGMIEPPPGMPREIQIGSTDGQARRIRGFSPALRHTGVKVVHRNYEPNVIRLRRGLPLSPPALALIEFAASATDREVRFAFLEACRLKLIAKRDVENCFQRMVRRRGAKKLRPYLALWVPELGRIRSVLEGWFLLTWAKRELSMPRVNEKLFGYEVDFHWPAKGLILEMDGEAFHGGPVQQSLDAKKQRFLEGRGYTVVRATFQEFAADPDGLVDRFAREYFEIEFSRE